MLYVPISTLLPKLQNILVKWIGKYISICNWGNRGPNKAYVFLISELNTSLSPGSQPTLYSACDAGTGSLRKHSAFVSCSLRSAHRHQRESARLEKKEYAPCFHSTVLYPGSSRSFQFTYFSTLRAIAPPPEVLAPAGWHPFSEGQESAQQGPTSKLLNCSKPKLFLSSLTVTISTFLLCAPLWPFQFSNTCSTSSLY